MFIAVFRLDPRKTLVGGLLARSSRFGQSIRGLAFTLMIVEDGRLSGASGGAVGCESLTTGLRVVARSPDDDIISLGDRFRSTQGEARTKVFWAREMRADTLQGPEWTPT